MLHIVIYCQRIQYGKGDKTRALAGVAQWIEYWPANCKVAGSILSQGICLACGPGPQLGHVRGN